MAAGNISLSLPAHGQEEQSLHGNATSSVQTGKASEQSGSAPMLADKLLAPNSLPMPESDDPFEASSPLMLIDEQPSHQTNQHVTASAIPSGISLLDAVPAYLHVNKPTSDAELPSGDSSHPLPPSTPQLEQSLNEQSAAEPASSAAHVEQTVHTQHQAAIEPLLTTADMSDNPEATDVVAHSQAASAEGILDELDALSADDDDFAENVELSAAGVPAGTVLPFGTSDADSSLLEAKPHPGDEQAVDIRHLQEEAPPQLTAEDVVLAEDSAPPQTSTQEDPNLASASQASTLFTPVQQDTDGASQASHLIMLDTQSDMTPQASQQQQQQQQQLKGDMIPKDQRRCEPEPPALQPHQAAMAKAEEAERRLLTGERDHH